MAARSASSAGAASASCRAGRAVGLEEADELDQRGPGPSVAVGDSDGAQPDGRDAAVVERGGVAAGRVVQVGPAAGHPGPEVRADRARGRRPCRRSCTRSRAGRSPRRPPRRRCCGPRSASPPGRRGGAGRRSRRRGTVLPAIASVAAVGAEVGLRGDRDRAARQALADVVVGLADQAQLDARARRTRRTTGRRRRAARAGSGRAARRARGRRSGPAPNERSAVDSRRPAGRDRALAAERGRDRGLERRRRRVRRCRGPARRGIGAPRRGRPPTAPAPMTGASSARAGRRRRAAAGGSRRRSRRRSAPRPPPARAGGPRRWPVK